MDWVQNKSTGKKNQQTSHAKGKGESTTSASRWLEDLCHENIALLQSSLPLKKEGKAGRRKASVDRPLVESLEWGVTALSTERNADLEYLHGLMTAIGRVESTGAGSKLPSEKKVSPEKIAKWIGKQLPLRSEEPVIALMAAGWIHGLPSLGRHLEPTLWLETLQTILSQVDRSWAMEEPESMLAWLIWSCEVPLALASHLAHLGSNDRIVSDTLDRLALVLELCKDKKSPWIRRGGSHLRALLACVLRCRWTADLLGARRWYSSQRKALVELACTAIALSDHHGKPLLVDEELGETDAGLWGALLEATEHSSKFADMLSSLPKPIRPSKIKKPSVSTRHLPLGIFDEGAELALMRREWKSDGCRIAVDFACDPMWLDILDHRGERLLSGWWEIAVSKNGKPLDIDCGWSEVCWFSDDDVDYLEVQCEVEGECVLQRQILLAREEGLVFIADALIGTESAQWELESRLPLASGIQFLPEIASREGFLGAGEEPSDRRALVLPVALPEWRKLNASGELTSESEALVLTQRSSMQRLYSPLALGLRKRHQSAPYTWRQLTVAEELKILSREVATAYRVQIGKEQWVLYRSLTQSTRRTTMGLHLNSEFYAGRFDSEDGQYEALVEVDAESA